MRHFKKHRGVWGKTDHQQIKRPWVGVRKKIWGEGGRGTNGCMPKKSQEDSGQKNAAAINTKYGS